ncbi:MAG: T9SS type A sorting domain-containing protein [Bacteroidetes bacterium]|nr:T9SS type A sorting domain-containing protein [Bacteroidota bacterium]
MNTKIILIGVILLFHLCNLCFSQTNYFVDGANGNDGNTGTSLVNAWQTIQNACNNATPNSIVYIKGGTYNENLDVNVSGTAGNPITFRNYMNDSVYIDGTGTTGTAMLYMLDKSYLNFQNLVIQNRTVNDAQGIAVECSATGSVKNLSFKKIIIRHINWTNNPAAIPGPSNNSQGFIAYGYGNNQANAIGNITIDSCEAYSNILGFSEAMTLDGNVDGFTISNCKIHDNTNIGIDIAGNYLVSSNPAVDHARNGSIINCECYRNVSSYATSAGIYVDGGWNTVIEKCKSYENGWGIEVGCEEDGTSDSITVKNNLIYNNEEGGLSIGGYTTATTGQVRYTTIRNNTFFQNNSNNNGNGEIYMTKVSNSSIINNIFYTNAQNKFMYNENISPQTSNVLNYNCWFTPNNNANNISVDWRGTNYSTFSSYKSGTGQEANSFYSDPAFVSATLPAPDLHSFSSLCIDGGDPSTLISAGETDYEGNPRINLQIDVGAYELWALGVLPMNKNENAVMIYPNPFSESTTIQITSHKSQELRMKLFDVFGREVKQFVIRNSSFVMERGDLPDGIYFYEIRSEEKNIGKGKIIIQ